MARYIVPAEMPKSCAHCQFSILKYQHPFWSQEKPNTKGYCCPFTGLTLELEFKDYTSKADWCPLVDADDFAPKSEWISVEERSPEKSTMVLCFYPGKDYGSKCVVDYAETDNGHFAEQFRYGTPSHWMPLPEPPQMKGGAE